MNQRQLALGVVTLVGCLVVRGAEFANLGFDEADTSGLPSMFPYPNGQGDIADLLPGWALFFGTNKVTSVYVNDAVDSVFTATLWDHNAMVPPPEGRFELQLARSSRSTTSAPPLSLQQAGTIPGGTRQLVFRTLFWELEVRINGQTIPPLNSQTNPMPGFSNVTTNLVYDISSFAGQQVLLEFLQSKWPCDPFGFCGENSYIDSIRFVTGPSPTLQISQSGGQVTVSWPASTSGYSLQSADFLSKTNSWTTLPAPVVIGDVQAVALPIDAKQKFYRLSVTCDGCGP